MGKWCFWFKSTCFSWQGTLSTLVDYDSEILGNQASSMQELKRIDKALRLYMKQPGLTVLTLHMMTINEDMTLTLPSFWWTQWLNLNVQSKSWSERLDDSEPSDMSVLSTQCWGLTSLILYVCIYIYVLCSMHMIFCCPYWDLMNTHLVWSSYCFWGSTIESHC